MIAVRDTSIVNESLFEPFAKGQPVSAVLAKRDDYPALVDLAFNATCGDPGYLDDFIKAMESDDMLTRYWAAHACLTLGKDAKKAEAALTKLTKDPEAGIRVTAAHALHAMGIDQTEALIAELTADGPDKAKLGAINSLRALGLDKKIPAETLKELAKSSDGYVKRFAGRLQE